MGSKSNVHEMLTKEISGVEKLFSLRCSLNFI